MTIGKGIFNFGCNNRLFTGGVFLSKIKSNELVFSVVTTTANTVFTLPLVSTGTYNFTVNWGDLSSSTITSYGDTAKAHTYTSSGTYIVEIIGTITGWAFNNSSSAPLFNTVYSWGELVLDPNGYQFYGCSNMTWSGTAIGGPNTSNVSNMSYMFRGCTNFNQSVKNFNTSNVTAMLSMFRECINFNQPVSNFDTSKVTSMYSMFNNCSNFNQSVSNFDISLVTSMANMFYDVTLSTSYYDAALIAWAPEALTGAYLFHGGNSKYTAGGDASVARSAWQAKGWTITDGGIA